MLDVPCKLRWGGGRGYKQMFKPMQNETLEMYVANELRSGAKRADIQDALLSVGWSDDEVSRAYARALIASGVPVPDGAGKMPVARKASTADVMIGFFSFILLGIVVSATGSLFFEIVNRYFPDPVANAALGTTVSSDAVHYSMAALFIGTPLYFFAIRLWFRRFREDDARAESRLTKWVTYLVLLVAAVTVVGDCIAILYTFLQGEISVRFFLKALVILTISGLVFGFYFLERKKIQYKKDIARQTFQSFGWGLFGLVVCGIVAGFFAVGSPTMERNRTFDARRANDLEMLAGCVSGYAQEFSHLPNALSDLKRSSQYGYCFSLKDPETGDAYEYRLMKDFSATQDGSEAQFELCAVFSLASEEHDGVRYSTTPYSVGSAGKWGAHASGRTCTSETVVLKKNRQYPQPLSPQDSSY